MSLRSQGARSQLFTLRVWLEETGEGRTEWRGKLQRVVDGETLYFREWDALRHFLHEALASPGEGEHPRQAHGQRDTHPEG